MTIPATLRKAGPYAGDGANTTFTFAFKVFTTADIEVRVADNLGVETLLVLDSGYSVTLNGDQDTSPGGSVTYPISGTPLAADEVLVITGAVELSSELALPAGGSFNPGSVNNAIDRATIQIQQLNEQVSRAVLVNPTSATLPADLLADINTAAGVATAGAAAASGSAVAADASADAAAADLATAQALLLAAKLGAGADIASAATLNLTARTGNIVRITGTTATTAVTLENGGRVELIAPAGWQLTYHATNNPVQGGQNYICQAGDIVIYERDGGSVLHNWIEEINLPGKTIGEIFDFAGTSAPTGSLVCPTSATNISRTTYARLFAAIGTTWGVGDGSTTFGMPWFAAGYAAVQANANVGTSTVGENLAHTHSFTINTTNLGGGFTAGSAQNTPISTNTDSSGGSANLAAGVRVLKCVKY